MQYRIGDRVRIRYDLMNGPIYRMFDDPNINNTANREMVKHAGQIVTISDINFGQYLLDELRFYWTDEMFEGFADDADDAAFEFDPDKLFEGW